jgi:radical SAM superfamily enzyme with C-terminal helix-hairpin-helix motif
LKVAILDGYVDEPSCLGVPPYVAPYPRYIAGMLREFGVSPLYITIDRLREDVELKNRLTRFDLQIIIAGIAVPGKYLGGKPLSKKEIYGLNLAQENILVGPVVLEMGDKELKQLEDVSIFPIQFPFEKRLFQFLSDFFRNPKPKFDLDRFSISGADVIKQHPDYPYIICEIETYRGCYWGKCSFCIERIHKFWMRDAKSVVAEIKALYNSGARFFRLGRQTDFLTYLADYGDEGVPEPNPDRMRAFHRLIWSECPKIRTLHLDNINPKTIAEYPEKSAEIIKIIITYQTPGNVAAMGLESADETVVRRNSLCASPNEVMKAIEIVNRYGRFAGYNGLPYFLPGVNFVIGLKGETKETFSKNLEFLREVTDRGFLLRRINIRQVKIFRGTPMEKEGYRRLKRHKRYFRAFKKTVREVIDNQMMRRILPRGRKLTDLRCEMEGKITYARQLATYPILVGIVGRYKRNTFLDVRVVDWGYRSVTAVKYPLNVNKATYDQLQSILGDKVSVIISKRPFKSIEEVKNIFREAEMYFTLDNESKLHEQR